MCDAGLAQLREQLDSSRQRPPLREQLTEELAVARLDRFRFLRRERPAELAGDRPREEAAAHTHPAVDPPAIDRHRRLGECALPGEDVRVDGVHERPVQVEDQRSHSANLVGGATRRSAPGRPCRSRARAVVAYYVRY